MNKKFLPDKKYYTIGEFAKIVNVEEYVLRYWESVFPQLKPHKTDKGHRRYSDQLIEIVNYIKELMWDKKYTIEGAKKALSEYNSKKRHMQYTLNFSDGHSKKTLIEIKKALDEIIEVLDKN